MKNFVHVVQNILFYTIEKQNEFLSRRDRSPYRRQIPPRAPLPSLQRELKEEDIVR